MVVASVCTSRWIIKEFLCALVNASGVIQNEQWVAYQLQLIFAELKLPLGVTGSVTSDGGSNIRACLAGMGFEVRLWCVCHIIHLVVCVLE